MVSINDITVTSLDVITGFGLTSGEYLFTLDELQSASIAQTQDKVDITGKQGRKLTSLKRNKAVTISGANGLVSGGLFEMQTGGTFETKQTFVRWTDYLTAATDSTNTSATTSYKAQGTAGAEIDCLCVKNSDGTISAVLEQAATAASGKFAYDPTTKKLTFTAADVPAGTEVVVFYDRKISASVLENGSDVYSQKCTLYVDATAEDLCGNVYRVQFYIPKADFSGEFTFEMGDNQTVHNFEAEALAGACGTAGSYWTYTIFGANAPDVTA